MLAVTRLEDRLTPATTEWVVASGSGVESRPLVQLYRADGTIRAQFLAFDQGFTGGVNVAVADVNADGFDDVIAAAGPGGGPHVKVFDGRSLNNLFDPTRPAPAVVVPLVELFSFYAYATTTRGGVSVATGDIDGDAHPDVITGAGPGGGPHVKVFSGKTGEEIRSFWAFDPAYRGGVVSVAAGHLRDATSEGPGYDILAASGVGMPATVNGFDGSTGEKFFSVTPFGGFRGGASVAAADLTTDPYDDVIIGAGPSGGPHIVAYDGFTLGHLPTILLPAGGLQPVRSFYAFDPSFRGGVLVAAADLDGDSVNDLIAGSGPTSLPTLRAFRGTDGRELFAVTKFGYDAADPESSAGVSVGARPLPTLRFGPPTGDVVNPVP